MLLNCPTTQEMVGAARASADARAAMMVGGAAKSPLRTAAPTFRLASSEQPREAAPDIGSAPYFVHCFSAEPRCPSPLDPDVSPASFLSFKRKSRVPHDACGGLT
jgi:hypothetical protein